MPRESTGRPGGGPRREEQEEPERPQGGEESGVVVSVIIPAYGRPDLLEKAVRSAVAQDLDPGAFEVIVVDSSADDTNEALVGGLAPDAPCRLRCFRKKPEGPGPSRNLGVRHARGRILAFMDSDCQASPGWLRHGLAAFEDGVGLVQGRTIPEPGVPHSVFHRTLEIQEESCFYETANVFYRREAFEEAGGFRSDRKGDRAIVVGGEDVDLAWKVKGAGWESRFAPDALVMHAVLPIPMRRWFFEVQVGTVPRVVRWHPHLRRFFFARYFYNRNQALFVLGLVGLGASLATPGALLLLLPWFADRVREPSRTLKGPLRLVRPLLYFPRDLATFGALLAGSIRYRALLL